MKNIHDSRFKRENGLYISLTNNYLIPKWKRCHKGSGMNDILSNIVHFFEFKYTTFIFDANVYIVSLVL